MARDNEDRIVQLQNRVEDMHQEVVKQRKEIQEYKGKEQKSLEQISAVSFLM
jgi:predicted  nucleic acid-binding Zn-ribbon protein